MRWFGFGFNAFEQILPHDELNKEGLSEVKIIRPVELTSQGDGRDCKIRACWSRRTNLYFNSDSCVYVAGFGAVTESCGIVKESHGCKDVFVSESHLTLAFSDRLESWDLQKVEKTPTWSMELNKESSDSPLNLPLLPGGYIATKAPLYRSLSPHLKAKSVAVSAEHVMLLSATGAVYTWGLGSHGQLGHGVLTSEEKPRAVEALWGMPMVCVATGGWHSVCISDGGDLYVWGWNESGQLGLPSRSLRKTLPQQSSPKAGSSSTEETQEGDKHEEVFISIQAFPALLDVSPSCEIMAVSCGSRHTAAVTTTGDLYTCGWGDYGQLGHPTLKSTDEPQLVEFFKKQQMRVVDVVCGAWNTFVAVVEERVA
ncbi:RCC1 domain-containing protein 1 isoform X1 [Takifugu flavidus]|uniref:RCC1 domain-containing protein 1 isoform X1 n=1 Tax=Takifugu flavidus TaxID=433684 RepID=UPI0005D213A5|nr:RCC1 domain-containing protein 1 isoform X1 [Takifugu flavidus]|eukprot:XP_011605598.1 PREDICTED: RCC1 domain-containing protein 1 [Takifugu rubripes]